MPLDDVPSQRTAADPGRTAPTWDRGVLRAEASRLFEMPLSAADDDVDLFERGLGTAQLTRLADRLHHAGAPVGLTELARDPRLAAWHALLGGGARGTGEHRAAPSGPPPLAPTVGTRDDQHEPFELTPVQQAYWIGRRDDVPLGGAACHTYLEADAADVDPQRLETAVRALLDRHPLLRARLDDDGTQCVLPVSPWPGLTVHDLAARTAEEVQETLGTVRETLTHRRLDVARGEVLDVRLSRLPGSRHRIHLTVDLLVAEVPGIRLLLADLAALYDSPSSAREPDHLFARHLVERTASRAEERIRARDHWQRRLPDLPGGPRLPLAAGPAEVTDPRFVRRTHALTADASTTLRQRAAAHGVTFDVLLATAFAEVLSRWSGERRFLLNLPLSDQAARPGTGRVVPGSTGSLLLEVDLARGKGFAEHVRAVQTRLNEDVAHAAYTGAEVLRDVARRDGHAACTAPVVFACAGDAPLAPARFATRFGEVSWTISQRPQVWLDHQVQRTRDGGLLLVWDAVEELFPDGMLNAMMSGHRTLLHALTHADWALPPTLPLPADQRRRREEVNAPVRTPSGRLLHERFVERAASRADEPAPLRGGNGQPPRNQRFRVVDGEGRDCPEWVPGELWIGGVGAAAGHRGAPALTDERFPLVRGERWYRTGDLGRYLPDGNLEFLGPADQQVKINGVRVGLGEIEEVLRAHPDVAGAVAAVAGDGRRELVAALVERTAVPAPGPGTAPQDERPRPTDLDEMEHRLVEVPLAELVAEELESSREAVRIGSLGATERQRPVLEAWLHHLAERDVVVREQDAVRPGPRWSDVRDFLWAGRMRERARDTHLEEIARALEWAGATLSAVLRGEAPASLLLDDPVLSPEALTDAMPGTRQCLAAVAAALADGSGEADGPPHVAEWDAASGRGAARLLGELPPGSVRYTLLGASTALLATAEGRFADSPHPVRTVHQATSAIPEAHVHAFDAVVANHVLHRMPDPETAAATMALLLKPGGRLHVVERTRLSPLALVTALPLDAHAGRPPTSAGGGERPAALRVFGASRWLDALTAAGLTGARVVRRERTGEVLITAERAAGAGGLDPARLRAWAAERLPAALVPRRFVALPALPLTGRGTLDRQQVQRTLTGPATRPREEAEPPQGATESTLATLWGRLLGRAPAGRDENFFALGGDSLLALRLVAEIRAALGVELPLRDVTGAPTVAGLGALVDTRRGAVRDGGPPTDHGHRER